MTPQKPDYLFIPMASLMVIASPMGGSLTGKVQPRYVIFASTLVAALDYLCFSFFRPEVNRHGRNYSAFNNGFWHWDLVWLNVHMLLRSLCQAEEIGVASSILALGRNIAGAFGIAIFGTILTDATNTNVLNIAYHSIIKILNPAIYQQAVELIILKAQIDAYKPVFISAQLFAYRNRSVLLINVSKEKMRKGHKAEEFLEV